MYYLPGIGDRWGGGVRRFSLLYASYRLSQEMLVKIHCPTGVKIHLVDALKSIEKGLCQILSILGIES